MALGVACSGINHESVRRFLFIAVRVVTIAWTVQKDVLHVEK